MNYSSKCVILTLISFLLLNINTSRAQNDFESGINLGFNIGGAKLMGEMNGFKETINEFNNQFGLATAFEVSKFLSPHFEIGLNFGYSKISGYLKDPIILSAQGFHYKFPPPPNQVVDPVDYINKLLKPGFFISYSFLRISQKSYFTPYIKTGIGYLTYKSEFRYLETGEIIFGKGDENSTNLSTASFNFGAGIISTVSANIFIKTSIDFNLVNYDFLDVVHNYDDNGNRLELLGVYSEIKIGMFFTTKRTKGGKKSSGRKGKSGKSSSNGTLPFAR